jgi:cell wall-associated NlpC family hydrolase
MNACFGSVREPVIGSSSFRGSKRRSRLRVALALTLAAIFVTAVTDMTSASAAPSPSCSKAAQTTNRVQAMCIALSKIGKPYVYGATGPNSFDCSGLVLYSFKAAGVGGVARSTYAQYDMYKTAAWRRVSSPSLGDLVFLTVQGKAYAHVGIYIGNGYVVHAPYPGKGVRKEAMSTIGPRSGYYLHLDS